MFNIEKSIAIIVTLSDLINTCCNDQMHKTTCTGLLLTFIRIIITTANPVCVKNNNEKQMILEMQDEINILRNEIRKITNKKKRRNEKFRRRLGIIQENEMYDRQPNYNHLEFEDETGETSLPLLAISQS